MTPRESERTAVTGLGSMGLGVVDPQSVEAITGRRPMRSTMVTTLAEILIAVGCGTEDQFNDRLPETRETFGHHPGGSSPSLRKISPMLRFSANLGFLWPDRPLLDRIDAAAAAGFRAVELHWPYDVPPEHVRTKCAAHGLALLGVNTVRGNVAAGENGLGAIAGREEEFQAAVDQSLAFCRAAGGTAVHCMAGVVEARDRAAAHAVFVNNLKIASGKATRAGLTLLLEPLNPSDAPDYFYSTVDEGATIIADTGCSNIRLMFDCYHVGRVGGDVIATLERLLPIVGHVQIAAVPSRAEPDQGTLDYRTVFAALERLPYDGWTGCEYKPAGPTDEGLTWTRALDIDLSATR